MSDTAAPVPAPDWTRGAVLLTAAIVIVCAVVGFGPILAAKVAPTLLGAEVESGAAVESLFTLLVFGPLVAVATAGAKLFKINAFGPGADAASMFPLGLALGVGGLLASAGLAWLSGGMVPGASARTTIAMLAWGAVVVAVQTGAEEVVFRGWLQPALARLWGIGPALGATALAFALAHVAGGARAPLSLVNLLLGGLVFGVLAARTGGIAAPVGMHWAWNAAEQLLLGLDPNPGVGSFGALADRDLLGRALWGGSGEGLNASLGMTVALLAILAPLAILGWLPVRAPWRAPSRSGPVPS